MNLPNKLTCIRLILIPVFAALFFLDGIVPYNYLIAAAVFALAAITDFLDGKIARKYGLVTNLGKFLDPIADKVLVSTALLLVAVSDVLYPVAGVCCVAVIIARELIISGFRQVAAKTGLVMAADYFGKVKTWVQDISLLVLLVALQFKDVEWLKIIGNISLFLAALLTVVSGINYIVKNRKVLQDKK